MDALADFFKYVWEARNEVIRLTGEHILMSMIAIIAGTMVSVPAGIFISRKPRLGNPVIDLVGMLYTVPSLALLGFLIPFLGLGWTPAITALVIYSLLPLLRNTFVGISEVDSFIKEAAVGMGATKNQLLWRVELPLAMPVIMAGLRTVAVLTVGITTMGALVGAGGLGVLIFSGIHLMDNNMLLAGTIPVALIAITFDQFIGYVEKRFRSLMGGGGAAA